MEEKLIHTPTTKALLERRAVNGSEFYLPKTSFAVFEEMASLSGGAVVVYVAILITVFIRGQWSSMPQRLRDRINLNQPNFSRAVKQLEGKGCIQVRREPGKKMRFQIPGAT